MKFTKDDIRKSMLLYVVTDRSWLKESQSLISVCEDILKNGATFLQIREKDLDFNIFKTEAIRLKKLCMRYNVPYVVNDNVELALEIDADGVHVGQSDIKGRDIRNIIGENKILGISVGSVEEAIAAENAGADYIGVGAVFATSTKKDADNLTVDKLKQITSSVSIPVVAIGGINNKNLIKLSGSGIDGVAVVSAIFASDNPSSATVELLEIVREMVEHG